MQEIESTHPLTIYEKVKESLARMEGYMYHYNPAAQLLVFWAQPDGQPFGPASMRASPIPQQGAQPPMQPGFRAQWNGTWPLGYVMRLVLPSWAGQGRAYGHGGMGQIEINPHQPHSRWRVIRYGYLRILLTFEARARNAKIS